MKIKMLNPTAYKPARATRNSAGYDLAVPADMETVVIPPGGRHKFSMGFAVSIPDGTVPLVFSRSGHGDKNGIRLSNCVAVIDPDYRGEWKLSLRNDSDVPFTVQGGDRIAQVVFTEFQTHFFDVVDELDETERGSGGFGSTGTSTKNAEG